MENENSCFMQNENPRILVLWKTRIGEFSFFGKSESENSRFVENETPRILVLWKRRIGRFVEKKKKRGPALCGAVRRGTGASRRCAGKKKFRLEFSFCGKRESGNSLFLESETPRILVL